MCLLMENQDDIFRQFCVFFSLTTQVPTIRCVLILHFRNKMSSVIIFVGSPQCQVVSSDAFHSVSAHVPHTNSSGMSL